MDTVNSYVIGWIERLVWVLKRWKMSGSLKDKDGIVDKMVSLVQQMKYSYLEPDEIIERYVTGLLELANHLVSKPLSERQRRFVAFIIEELKDTGRKLKLVPKEPFQVFRFRFGVVESASEHPTLDLKVLRVKDKYGIERTVVTNLKDIKDGEHVLVVLLPPREFEGIWSEAMIVQRNVSDPAGVKIDELRRLNTYYSMEYG